MGLSGMKLKYMISFPLALYCQWSTNTSVIFLQDFRWRGPDCIVKTISGQAPQVSLKESFQTPLHSTDSDCTSDLEASHAFECHTSPNWLLPFSTRLFASASAEPRSRSTGYIYSWTPNFKVDSRLGSGGSECTSPLLLHNLPPHTQITSNT